MMMNENYENGGGSIGGDSEGSASGSLLCRDFMRNVCQRGSNCRFVHPDNIKIRKDPIFCHDWQQQKCRRSNCKFIHCSREEEENFKQTGEVPMGINDPEGRLLGLPKKGQRLKNTRPPAATQGYTINGNNNGNGQNEEYGDMTEIPLCKDFLKGVCDRPPGGCKFRHMTRPSGPSRVPAPGFGRTIRGPPPAVTGYAMVNVRRKVVRNPYEDEGPANKRYHLDDYNGDGGYEEYEVDESCYSTPAPPPPPRVPNYGMYAQQGGYPPTVSIPRNGYQYQPECRPYYQSSSHSDAMKALEDENFMLKRRIEELKSSNEFLLNQNAQLRLNNSLSAGTSVTQVQPLAVTAVSVSGAMPTAQPSIIGITSSSLSGTQPLPTISISTIPTVSSIITPVSISQSMQSQPQTQTQIYLPAPN